MPVFYNEARRSLDAFRSGTRSGETLNDITATTLFEAAAVRKPASAALSLGEIARVGGAAERARA